MSEHFFTTWDGTRLFYRAWLPEEPASKALVLFHRGHEHSGRFEELVERLQLRDFAVFAWDARGHGRSPGERGWAPGFAALVRDADCFVKHISAEYGIPVANIAVLAHSIGAVLAAVWVHDYAPPISALILASPAFRVKLYVPFALAFLRLQLKFRKKAFVKSYVRPSMLTHDPAECEGYAKDPLISRPVAVNLLVEMHDASTRVVADAAAITAPTLLLSSGKDYVVKLEPQRRFFRDLGSTVKESEEYGGFYHDLLHERDRERPIARILEFLLRATPTAPPGSLKPARKRISPCVTPTEAGQASAGSEPSIRVGNEREYERLRRPLAALSPATLNWSAQRLFLKTIGNLSLGIQTGWRYGFDSGESLDYVYRDTAGGITPLGRMIDRIYLNSPGWRGIRLRKRHIEELLRKAVDRVRSEGRAAHILDPAAGGGRYVLETVARLSNVSATLRDWSQSNVDAAARLARSMQIAVVTVARGDAFDRSSLAEIKPTPDIAIVSGLYELFPDNAKVSASLLGLADALPEGGWLIYTNQLWHPQLEMIARVLDNRDGERWVMRCRPQMEMDSLVRAAGFEKVETLLDDDGIFSVSLARRARYAIACSTAELPCATLSEPLSH
ncbi:MAG TPA: bifunctional alpha/beta hydrolase/class I SAM-dependent methyltransferase [Bryobacteraceae bacterium]|nr:bifunctional alpha/beta hydrolase/class I SAM-dependent methyltransferase [Bryobacteraceae bacterium]